MSAVVTGERLRYGFLGAEELPYYNEILDRMKAAGAWKWSRGLAAHPAFVGAEKASDSLLDILDRIGDKRIILCMRDACLRPFRQRALERGYTLLIPDEEGHEIYRIPPSALRHTDKGVSLRIDPLPFGTTVWRGGVDAVVVGCTAWQAGRRALWSFDWDNTNGTLDGLHEGVKEGDRDVWELPRKVLTICLAADEQEVVEPWPGWAVGHRAALVVTPTRRIALGTKSTAPGQVVRT